MYRTRPHVHRALTRLFHQTRTLPQVSAQTIARVREAFPSTAPRLDLVQDPRPSVRVAILPLGTTRPAVKLVLDNVLADPLSSDQGWHEAIRDRALTRTLWITHNETFDIEINDDNVVEYKVPFNAPKHQSIQDPAHIEIVEANDMEEVNEPVHRVLYVTNDPETAYGQVVNQDLPHDIYLDLSAPAKSGSKDITVISSETASKANKLLRDSPANANQYLSLLKTSNIAAVQTSIFGSTLSDAKKQVLKSVFKTCQKETQDLEDSLDRLKSQTSSISKLRREWANESHHELQTSYTKNLDSLRRRIAWYTLYYKADDVHSIVAVSLAQGFLDKTKTRLEYLVGRIDEAALQLPVIVAQPESQASLRPPVVEENHSSAVTSTFQQYRRFLVDDLAVRLHNYALRSVLVTAVIQAASLALPLAAAYLYYPASWAYVSPLGGVAVLGLAAGSYVLRRRWTRALAAFQNDAVHQAKLAIDTCELDAWRLWEQKIKRGQETLSAQKQALAQLEKELD